MKFISEFRSALILLPLLWSGVVCASSIEEVKDIARAGAPELALSMVHRFQPEHEKLPVRWASWESLQLDILAEEERWQDIIQRIKSYPVPLSPDFTLKSRTILAKAYLESGEPAQALSIYRKLLWGDYGESFPDEWRNWRLGVIRSYVGLERLELALIAWRRYEQDYPDLTAAERELRARLAMQAGQADEAVDVLRSVDEAKVMPVLLLAQLESDVLTPKKVIAQVEVAAKEAEGSHQAQLWWVAASASKSTRDGRNEIIYLQRALQQPIPAEKDPLFPLDAESLWDAYLSYGEFLGNKQGLLIGDDEAWLEIAQTEQDNLKQAAYYAVIALEGQLGATREKGHAGLMKVLLDGGSSTSMLTNLYLNSANFPTVEYIPEVVRPLLAEAALERTDHQLASTLMQGVNQAPEGADGFDWQLRRARIHILGGHEDLGIDVLYVLLAGHKVMDAKQVDRFLQVLFDLQTLKRDQEAIALFNALQPRLNTHKQQRELLFWMADSYKSLGQKEQAGYLYMRSAILLDGIGLDPWGQTARFFAAESLADAGFVNDARHLYKGLLRVAQDENRKMVLRQRLQHLQLMQ